jgi:hypothetical protein
MPPKHSASTKKAIRTRKVKSAHRKSAAKKRRAVARTAVATKKQKTTAVGARPAAAPVPPATGSE